MRGKMTNAVKNNVYGKCRMLQRHAQYVFWILLCTGVVTTLLLALCALPYPNGQWLRPHHASNGEEEEEAENHQFQLQQQEQRKSPSVLSKDKCKSLFTIKKERDEVVWDTDDQYEKLSLLLPSLLEELPLSRDNQSHFKTLPETRLNLMRGRVPYIPCQVVEYDAEGLWQCYQARKKSGASTWIAFLGDSNVRNKMLGLLSFLPKNLRYRYFLGNREVTKKDMYLALGYPNFRPPSFEVFGFLQAQSTQENISKPFTGLHGSHGNFQGEGNSLHQSNIMGPSNTTVYFKRASSHFSPSFTTNTLSSSSSVPHPYSYFSPSSTYPSEVYYSKLLDPRTGEIDPKGEERVHYNSSSVALLEKDIPFYSYELRITLVWGPFSWKGIRKIREWADGESYPDVITVSFGMWMYLLGDVKGLDFLTPFTELDARVRELTEILSKLSLKTRVLIWALSSIRWFKFEDVRKQPGFNYTVDYWKNILSEAKFNYGIRLLSAWTWRILRNTGAWLWDSTVPFHIANVKECEKLIKAGDNRSNFYYGMWWLCKDYFHPSHETNNNEMQMLINFLCNKHVAKDQHENCCVENGRS